MIGLNGVTFKSRSLNYSGSEGVRSHTIPLYPQYSGPKVAVGCSQLPQAIKLTVKKVKRGIGVLGRLI